MEGKTHADIPLSFFEYRATYQEPLVDAQLLYWKVTRTVLQAFRPWNVTLEEVSFKQNPANFAEFLVTFSLLSGKAAFNVSFGSTVLVVKNPNWAEARVIIEIAKAGLGAVLSGGNVVLDKQRASIAMHLKPNSGSIKEFVAGFAPVAIHDLNQDEVRAYGISIYKQDSTWVVDASASYANALFVRIDHSLERGVPLEEIASRLQADEAKLLDLLRLEVD